MTRTADQTLGIIERDNGQYIVLMDNYHANDEAQRLLRLRPSYPELRQQLRTIGMTAYRPEELAARLGPWAKLDGHIMLPLTFEGFIGQFDWLSTELEAARRTAAQEGNMQ